MGVRGAWPESRGVAAPPVHTTAPSAAPPAQGAGTAQSSTPIDPRTDDLLRRLETADQTLGTLEAQIQFIRTFPEIEGGGQHIRRGTLAFAQDGSPVGESGPGAAPAPGSVTSGVAAGVDTEAGAGAGVSRRRFAVRFTTEIVDGQARAVDTAFVFDGAWLAEIDGLGRVFIRRLLAGPGSDSDPTRIGRGPVPLPIGQKRDEMARAFELHATDPLDGLDGPGVTESLLRLLEGTEQLRLRPRPGTREAGNFRDIRVWYRSRDLLPVYAQARNTDDTQAAVFLVGLTANAALSPERFSTEPPREPGWQVSESVDQAAPPTPTAPRVVIPVRVPPIQGPTVIPEAGPQTAPEAAPSGGAPGTSAPSTSAPGQDAAAHGAATAPLRHALLGRAPLVPPPPPALPVPEGVGAPAGDGPMDELSPAVRRAVTAPFLSQAETRAARLRHGVPTAADLSEPGDRARHAVIAGAWHDPSLSDAAAATADRAEALLLRGQVRAALGLLGQDESPRGLRLRAEGLELLGRLDLAAAVARRATGLLVGAGPLTPADQAEAVRAALVLLRAQGETARGAAEGDFQALIALLGDARRRDGLEWRVPLAEGVILLSKDNYAQAQEALREAIGLNPSAWEPRYWLGVMAVLSLNLEAAQEIAGVLESRAALAGAPGGGSAVSAPAAIIRAKAALRLNDPDGATAALGPALERDPAGRALRAQRAAAVAVRYDWAALDSALAEFDAIEADPPAGAVGDAAVAPGAPAGACLLAGQTLSEARQYAQAARLLRTAGERAPNWSEPLTELGLVLLQAGRDEESLAALESAARLDPFSVRVGNSLKLVRELAALPVTRGGRFVVRSRPGLDQLLAAEMTEVLDRIDRQVSEHPLYGLGAGPASPTVVELMPDHAWFAVRIAGLPQIHTIAAATGPVIAMETPRDGPGHSGSYDWERVVRHEYGHTVGLHRTNNRLPHWFTEAQAVLLELAPRSYETAQLLARAYQTQALFGFEEINLAFARPRKPTDRAQAYAQGAWMLEYMIERWGPRAPRSLMDQYAAGAREEEAFGRVLGVSRAEFMGQFLGWAQGQLRAWGMLPAEGVPGLDGLLEREAARRNAEAWGKQGLAQRALKPGAGEVSPQDVEIDDELVARWLAEHPGHPDVLEIAVDRAVEKTGGRATAAVADLLDRYARARPVDPKPHRLLAGMHLRGPEPGRAAAHLEYLDAREERTAVYAAELARLAFAAGDLPRASQKAERATRVAPYVAGHRELAAAVAVARGDYATAQRHVRFLVALEPDNPRHQQRLGVIERRLEG
ncbi:MAG: hypothetical protein C0475_07700 [Planctomyces sp.]|nr:hypothetical protein [Planctomyces sp.]